ncbi:NADP-dependent oxidoreductase [Spirosoma radiotolerans]|uniref:Alcohol dehydrogenase n=1 Tax=Spirosoma radiotolerans TaxID=1379870 RepID=A0A0E3ZSG4_9BACT|nr:NADP-dependent oxidoreductase [Spirosoma radiotolerans]AKD54355.1 alcohol dehydrogenase [Spirosoma radiotolerans]
MKTKTIRLKNRPVGVPKPGDFELVTQELPGLSQGEILLEASYISVDPYLRGKMSGTKEPRFELGQPITSKLIARVVESRNPHFRSGDYVSDYLLWQEFQIAGGSGLTKIDPHQAPLPAYLGVLGITGLSAYLPLLDYGQPKPGETLVVSGAAGAVGSIAGQIGKILGCRVVGIVGSEEKAELVKEKFGFDQAVNYRGSNDLNAAIASACPHGVDLYFDNVGGPISEAVIANINPYGRIIVCGAISNYNETTPALSPSLLPLVVYKFLRIQGFLIADFSSRFPQALNQLHEWLQQGKITYSETIVQGFENLPNAFIGLFEGLNQGKMIVEI